MIGDFNVGNDNAKMIIWSVNLCVGDQCLGVSRKTFRFSHKMIRCLLKNTYYVLLASLNHARFSDASARGPSPTSRYFFAAITTLLLLFLSPCLPLFAARGWMIVHSPVGWGCDEALGREPGRRDRRGGPCPVIGQDECHRACPFVIGCQRQVYRYGQVRLPATYSWWTPNAKCRWRGIKTNSENTFHCAAKVHSMVISQLMK